MQLTPLLCDLYVVQIEYLLLRKWSPSLMDVFKRRDVKHYGKKLSTTADVCKISVEKVLVKKNYLLEFWLKLTIDRW